MVFYTFTGLTTLLGLTTFLSSEENQGRNGLTSSSLPTILHDALPNGSRVVRQFAYDFTLSGLRVQMWHVRGPGGELSLVEVFEGGNRLIIGWGAVAAFLVWKMMS